MGIYLLFFFFFFQAEDGIRDYKVTGVQTCALPILAESIVWLEAEVGSPCENDARPRDPVGLLTVDQMPHDIERTERVGAFPAPHPRLAQAVEQRAQRGGRASQQLYRQIEIEFHDRDGGFISSHSDRRKQAVSVV